MNIVFLGDILDQNAANHVQKMREDHEVWIAPLEHIDYESAGRKICDADEIHVWLTPDLSTAVTFYLGVAFMFEYANLGQNVSYEVKLFNHVDPKKMLGVLGPLTRRG
jgi:hypothetical protein